MNKLELAQEVAAINKTTGEAALAAVSGITEALSAAFVDGHDVRIQGFGTFKVRATKARVGRNPKTGAPVDIPAGRKVTFKYTGKL